PSATPASPRRRPRRERSRRSSALLTAADNHGNRLLARHGFFRLFLLRPGPDGARCLASEDVVVELLPAVELLREAEPFLHAPPAGLTHPSRERRIASQNLEFFGDCGGLAARDHESGLAVRDVLGKTVGVCAHNGKLHRLGLEDGVAETLRDRGVEE